MVFISCTLNSKKTQFLQIPIWHGAVCGFEFTLDFLIVTNCYLLQKLEVRPVV